MGIPTPPTSFTFPLKLGSIGSLATGKCFDDRMTQHDESKFNGTKNGDAWSGKVKRYFMSRVPAIYGLFEWAERCDGEIDENMLQLAAATASATMAWT